MSDKETIARRFLRLNQLILGKSHYNLPNKYLAHRDGLLDVLFALYEELNVDYLRRDKHIATFVDKFKGLIVELKSLRINLKDFEAKKIIGRGHFGEVQVVREKGTGDVYAMKILSKQETLSQQNVAFYKEERDIMSCATSSWLTKLQYAFQDSNNLYLVMEFHPGGDMLSLLVKYNILPDDMCQFYLAELVLAIHSLHSMGYVHRDIKPDNILFDRTGHLKLADFGSASQLNSHKQVTSGMPAGTPDYVAPEVLAAVNAGPANSKSYGVECDWWSLGVVSYEMVFGSTPFANDKVLITYSNIMNFKNSLKFPPEASEVPEPLMNIIKGLLEESTKRFGYEQLIVHPFFMDIDWNNIHHTVPPYVPTVTSVDDTSNFDDYEPKKTCPYLGNLQYKKEFSGKNLPFVGFTFTQPFETNVERFSSSDETFAMSPSSFYDNQNSVKKKQVTTLLATVSQLTNAEEGYKNEIKKLKAVVESKDQEMNKSKDEKSVFEQIIEELNAEVQQVKQLLAYEREHRVITEQKSAQLIKCMKTRQKYDALRLRAKSIEFKGGEKEKFTLEAQLEEAFIKIDEFTKERAELLGDLEAAKHALLKCQRKCSEREHMVSVLSEENLEDTKISDITQNSSTSENKPVSKVQDLRRLVFNLEKKNAEIERNLNNAEFAKREAEMQVTSLQNTIVELQSTLKDLEKQLSKSQVQVLIDMPKTKDSEDSFATASENNNETFTSYESVSEIMQDIMSEVKVNAENIKPMENNAAVKCKKVSDTTDHSSKTSENGTISGNSQDVLDRNQHECFDESSEMKKENDLLKYRIESLNSEILKLNEDIQKMQNSYGNFEKQMKEKENALSEAMLDLRISKRSEQQAESTVTSLRERNKELREKIKILEDSVSEKTKTENQLKQQLKQVENELSVQLQVVTEKQKQLEIENVKHEERVKAMKYTCEISKDVTQKFAKSQDHYEDVIKQNIDLIKVKEQMCNENLRLLGELKTLKADLCKKENECCRFEKICKTIKSQYTDIENDFEDLQIIVDARDQTIFDLKEMESKLISKSKTLEDNLVKSQFDVKNAESRCEDLKAHIKDLTSEMDNNNLLHETEIQNLQDQLSYYKKVSKDMEEQIVQLHKDLTFQNKDSKSFSEKIVALESQLCEIKEEAARHISQISSLKTSNLKLTQSLEDSLEDNKDIKKSYDDLYEEFEGVKANHCHEKVKLQETIAQQTKLIDFLQSKAENLEKRKRPHLPRFFGKKDNAGNSLPIQYRDVEKLLESERSKCRRLQDQLSQLQDSLTQARTENVSLNKEMCNFKNLTCNVEVPVSPVSRAMHCAITHSPTTADLDSPVLVSKELVNKLSKPPGMKHKIPHRFSNVMCMRSTKCCACLDSLHFGRPIAKCQECSVVCHSTCALSLPNTCGLPLGFMQHFKTAINDCSSSSASESSICRISEGWIKMPKSNKLGWDRRYLRIIDNVLYVFENAEENDTKNSIIKLDFNSKLAKVVVTSAVSATELTYAASSDLPFVMKLEYFPHTTCWPQRCLYIMALNFSDKQMWVSALESLAEENQIEADSCQKNKLIAKTVWTLKGDKKLDPLCTYILDSNIILLGAVDGLYVLKIVNKFSCSLKCKIYGLQCVYQLSCLKSIGLMIMIQGNEKRLTMTQLSIVQTAVQNPFKNSFISKPLSDIHDVHLFAIEETYHPDSPYLCIATSKSILLYQWDTILKTFCSRKIIETKESCCCIHFAQNSIIMGTNSFYKLNLNTFAVKNFLDEKDSSLAGLIYGASQFRSFPIGIFQVSALEEPIEYLMCFHEMGVFVNDNGQRTRPDDMKWRRLPLSFAYQLPYLFVTHFNSLEVIEIAPQNVSKLGLHDVMMVQNPQLLGPGHIEQSIYLSSCHDQMIELILVDGKSIGISEFHLQKFDSVSITSGGSNSSSSKESTPESDALDFSFSTSIDQSLEEFSVDQTSVSSTDSAVSKS